MAIKTYEMVNYELAEIGTRFTALFIDGVILAIIESVGFLTAREIGFGAGFIVGLLYYWFFLAHNQGQTLGKMMMKIRVIKIDGSPISDSEAVARYLGYLINSVFVIGWLWALIDQNRQGWHDLIVRTYVVKAE